MGLGGRGTGKGARAAAGSSGRRYASYLRCSTDDQAEGDFTTIDTQREINARHIAAAGGQLVAEFSDPGRTGTNLKRRGWEALLAAARAGEFDAVCVTYMSRLGRGDAYTIAEYMLREAGAVVEMVKEKFSDDLTGYAQKKMQNFLDGMYPVMVRDWTLTKMTEHFGKGYFVGGNIPFGYQTVFIEGVVIGKDGKTPRRLVPDPDAAPLVRQAFSVYLATRNVTDVLEMLKAGTSRTWTYTKVKYLLTNPVYVGVARWRGLTREGAHEALIGQGEFAAVQEALQARAGVRRPKQNPKDTTPYYLRGLVFCPHCGGRMTPGDHHGKIAPVRYYECPRVSKSRDTSCPVQRVNAHTLHEIVVGEIEKAGRHPTRLADLMRASMKRLPKVEGLEERHAAAVRALRDVEKKIDRLTAAIENGGGAAVVPLMRRLEVLEAERFDRDQERARLEKDKAAAAIRRPDLERLRRGLAHFSGVWDAATDEERVQLVAMMVAEVRMEEKERGTLRLLTDVSPLLRECGNPVSLREVSRPNPHNGPLLDIPFRVPRGGKSRRCCRPRRERAPSAPAA